jgi:hypothetical protein
LLELVMERLEQTSRELATIYQTSKVISSGKGLNDILNSIKDELLLAVPESNSFAVFLFNEFNDEFFPVIAPEGSKEIDVKQPFIKSLKISEWMFFKEPAEISFEKEMFMNISKSLLVVPIKKADALLGFMALGNTKKTNAFKTSHLLLFSSVSGQLAEAIGNIKHQQEERDRQRLKEANQSII